MDEVLKTAISMVIVYSTHYGTAKLYDAFCVPDGIVGFLQGIVTTASPWCRLTLNIMTLTEDNYSNLVLLGLSRGLVGAIFPTSAGLSAGATAASTAVAAATAATGAALG